MTGQTEATRTTASKLPFTIQTLRNAIPAHCFEISLAKAIYYLVRDFAIIALLMYVRPLLPQHFVVSFLWWNVVGFFGWCLFVVGHDCGHRTFAKSVFLNDLFGHIAHAPLLVPFHGWRVSHRKHHEYHNHIHKDHSWFPISKEDYDELPWYSKLMRFSPLLLFLYPIYLVTDGKMTSGNHFNPYSRLFEDHERRGAWISTLSVVAFISFLFYSFDFLTILDYYVMPYLFFVLWLDMVTYLQHTDPTCLYYRDGEWTFLKGAISTVDRSYGFIVDHLHHDIGTHVAHHIFFTKIPHYNLVEATKALKPVLGSYYRKDDTPILLALLRSITNCHFVGEGDTVKYRRDEKHIVSWGFWYMKLRSLMKRLV